MAVQQITAPLKYTGLQSDTKPTGVPVGSTFLAADTGNLYITYDGTNWASYGNLLTQKRLFAYNQRRI